MSTIRAQQRASTQRNILLTARRLFLASSFEAVGVREIAAEAGVATGTVIAAFGSKVDLLHAIVIEDMNEQLTLMKAAIVPTETSFERIANICLACVVYQSNRIATVRAAMADAWTRTDEAENKIRKATKPLYQMVVDEVVRGISRGEIRGDLDVRLASLLILEILINTYRLPMYEDAKPEDLGRLLHARLDILLRGFASETVLLARTKNEHANERAA
jgi:AcrR family transcriptional regulator